MALVLRTSGSLILQVTVSAFKPDLKATGHRYKPRKGLGHYAVIRFFDQRSLGPEGCKRFLGRCHSGRLCL